MTTDDNASATTELEERILSTLCGCDKGSSDVKTLRKKILLSLQTDEKDKDAKKRFKKAVQNLEKIHQKLTLNEDGCVKLKQSVLKKKDKKKKESKKKEKKKKDESTSKKRKRDKDDERDIDDDGETKKEEKELVDGENEIGNGSKSQKIISEDNNDSADYGEQGKNEPCKGNNSGITRLFLGNLPFTVDDTTLKEFLSPGKVTHIKWITDKETGRFYGSAFIEMRNSKDAAQAVAKNNSDMMGRPIRINFAPARPGDVWPPKSKVITGGGQAGGSGVKAMREKPPDCVKMFIGNLSYDIDDDKITKFFASVDVEMKAVRWQHHRDSGDFKGCAFVEFWNSEACKKAGTLNGKNLLGRPIRMDWSD